ncbi:tRNA-dihydrouridine(47) synthase [NAD(P)(+)]-like [Haliotis rubra]|uniref:tRNA-dihydrouridine(47) synthase [NAD(P)(+)]-like n=1 Tax=Haliotis rubra TaxID=36100 RepID=UPI001EE57B8A|nr:tRNA-dihydrouridine(47) synthase [NAD(P)(+)]-like [Haliotis rubra]
MEEENLIDSCNPAGTEKLVDTGNIEKLVDTGNTEKLADSGYTEKLVDSGNTEKLADSGNTEKLVDTGNTEKLEDTGNTEKLVDTGNTEKLEDTGNTEKLVDTGNTEKLEDTGNTEKLVDTGNTEKLVDTGNTKKLADSGNTEKLVDTGNTEKLVDTGNTEKLEDTGNTEKLVDTGNTEKLVDTGNTKKLVDTGNTEKLEDSGNPESTNVNATSMKRPLEDEDSVNDAHVQLSDEQIQMNFRKSNMAWIKPQYILPRESQKASQKVQQNKSEPPSKKQKTTGRNRNRPVDRGPPAAEKVCPSIIMERDCFYGSSCKFCHDVGKFMANKPPDIGDKCYVFENYGRCSQSIACRYGSKHIDSDFKNVVNKELHDKFLKHPLTINFLVKDVQKLLWKKKYDFSTANGNVKKVQAWYNRRKAANEQRRKEENGKTLDSNTSCQRHSGCVTDEDLIKLRPVEKKKLDLTGKLYLAPLTTVGNLPFRRVCKGFGADVTCSEMAVATKLLQANQSEWALLKRHRSEDLFGVQVCGSYPDTMTRCAQLLTEVTTIDFVDINCGCPIDMVYKRGEGAALMSKPNKLEQIVKSMTSVLDVPLTLKMRTGISSDKDIAHNLIPKLRDWGVSEVTLHGRSREQRYTRLADWDYINRCAQLAAPMPVFGNGDVLSYEEYYQYLDTTAVGGIMIAR